MKEVPKEILGKFIREIKKSANKTTVIGRYLRIIADEMQRDDLAGFAMSVALYKSKLFLQPDMVNAFFDKILSVYEKNKANTLIAKIISKSMQDEDVESFSSLCTWHAEDEGSAEWSDRNAHVNMSIAHEILSRNHIDVIAKYIPVSLNASLMTYDRELNKKIICASRIESYIPISNMLGSKQITINGALSALSVLCRIGDYANSIDLLRKILNNNKLSESNISGKALSDAIDMCVENFSLNGQKAVINKIIEDADDHINTLLNSISDRSASNTRAQESSRSHFGFNLYHYGAKGSSQTVIINSLESLCVDDFLINREHSFSPLSASDLGKIYSSSAMKSYEKKQKNQPILQLF
jgi:hypothetical protein